MPAILRYVAMPYQVDECDRRAERPAGYPFRAPFGLWGQWYRADPREDGNGY